MCRLNAVHDVARIFHRRAACGWGRPPTCPLSASRIKLGVSTSSSSFEWERDFPLVDVGEGGKGGARSNADRVIPV